MLYCNNCGQCSFISRDNFVEWQSVSGSSKRYLDPDTEEIVDYGEDDLESTGDADLYCPHCDSSNVEREWVGEEEEAHKQREVYEEDMEDREAEAKREALIETIKDSDWDLESNLKI